MQKNIELVRYYKIFKKKAWLIFLGIILGSVISSVFTYQFIAPIYQAKTTIMIDTTSSRVEQENEDYYTSSSDTTSQYVTEGDINFSSKIAGTYMPILKSRKVIDRVIDKLDLNMSYEQLSQVITTTHVNNGQIIDIEVKSTSPRVAYDVANTLPDAFSTELRTLAKFDSVKVIDSAIMPQNHIYPNNQKNMLAGAVIGLFITILVVLLLDYFDNKLKTPDDIEEYLGLPILGVVISEDDKIKQKR